VGLLIGSMSLVTQHTSMYIIAGFTYLYGFLISMQYTGMNSLAYAKIGSDELSSATSIMSTIQQLAQSFGVASAALIISFFAEDKVLTITCFQNTFLVLGLLTACAIVLFVQLQRDDGNELI
jgi:hypothetical protein